MFAKLIITTCRNIVERWWWWWWSSWGERQNKQFCVSWICDYLTHRQWLLILHQNSPHPSRVWNVIFISSGWDWIRVWFEKLLHWKLLKVFQKKERRVVVKCFSTMSPTSNYPYGREKFEFWILLCMLMIIVIIPTFARTNYMFTVGWW